MRRRIRHVNIEVTKRCNQRCFYCFNNSGGVSRTGELEPAAWLRILQQLWSEGLESVHFTGGEPFLYESLIDLLASVQSLGLSTSILSNGFRVPEIAARAPEVLRRLTVAQVSLDSMTQEIHNRRRGHPDAWKHALAAIRAFRELSVSVEVSCVVNEENVNEIRTVAEYCDQNEVGLILRPMVSIGRAVACGDPIDIAARLHSAIASLESTRFRRLCSDRFHYVPASQDADESKQFSEIRTFGYDGSLRDDRRKTAELFKLAS